METRNVVKTVITISYKMIIFALVVIRIIDENNYKCKYYHLI